MVMDAFLGLDLGTSSVKALVVALDGEVKGRGSAAYPTAHPTPDRAEQNPDDWWRATVTATRQACAEATDCSIAAIGLSGQMHGTVLLGNKGPLGPAIIWSDRRSAREVEHLTNQIGAGRLIQQTGSALATGFQAATLAWLRGHEPERWQQMRTVLLPKDYLGWRLTGAFATEPSDASSTLLFDIHHDVWFADILNALGLRQEQLPPVIGSIDQRGTLRPDVATDLGLAAEIPVVGGGGDAPLAALVAGAFDPGTMVLTLSSGAQVTLPATTPAIDPAGRIHTWRSCLEEGARWYQMGATLASGLALTWLRDAVFGLKDPAAIDEIARWAGEATPGASGLLFLPYLAGERTPHRDPLARGVFLGLSEAHGRAHLSRAVMEGATFALRDAAEVLFSLGAKPERIVLAGGGGKSHVWRQIVADIFALPVSPLATIDGSALGAALLAGAGVGAFDLTGAAREWTRYDPAVEPNPKAHAIYEQLLPIFRNAYATHRDDFRTLAEIAASA